MFLLQSAVHDTQLFPSASVTLIKFIDIIFIASLTFPKLVRLVTAGGPWLGILDPQRFFIIGLIKSVTYVKSYNQLSASKYRSKGLFNLYWLTLRPIEHPVSFLSKIKNHLV